MQSAGKACVFTKNSGGGKQPSLARNLRVFAAILFLFFLSLPAAAQVPGDACATVQQYIVNGGPETLGIVHMMICEGGTWKSIVSSNAAGEVTKIGNQTCANGDYFKYDGTKFICTAAGGGAALSGLTAAIAANSINNGDNAQTWNWQLTTADKDAFTFTENAASTATGHSSVLKAATLATSTATPLIVTNLGAANSFVVNDETGDADATPFVIAADGKVGVGTATPENKFHLAENLLAPGIATLRINNTANQSSSAIVFEESNQGDNFTLRYNTDNTMLGGNENFFEFLGSGALKMSISRDTGNVGIGTAIGYQTPAKLEVRNSGTEDILNLYDGATEVLTVLDGGNVGIGTTTPGYKLTVSGDFADNGLLIENIRAADSDSGNVDFHRARGTPGSPVIVQNGDELGHIRFEGYDGAGNYYAAADIIVSVDGAPGAGGDMPGRIGIRTRADGAGSLTRRMTIDDSGSVHIGTETTLASKFVVQPPASQAIAGAATITADACGTIKQITSTGNVTTNTTNTFTASTGSYAGCCMTVINVDTADTITLDANTLFKTIGGANQALGPSDAVEVCSNGTNWYQIGAVSGNQ